MEIKRKRRRRKPRQRGRPSKYKPEFVAVATELGRKGWAVTEAANYFRVGTATFASWEARYEDFRKATKRIRSNSKFWAGMRSRLRVDRLAQKREDHLLEALRRVRESRSVTPVAVEQLRIEYGIEKIEFIPDLKTIQITPFEVE